MWKFELVGYKEWFDKMGEKLLCEFVFKCELFEMSIFKSVV